MPALSGLSARCILLLLLLLAAAPWAEAQREHTRLKPDSSAANVSEAQGVDVTLTKSTVDLRQVQQIVRTGGSIDKEHKIATALVPLPEAKLVKVGQRARAFAPESKSSMFQAFVTRVTPQPRGALVEVTLAGTGLANASNYVMEITVELGEFLSVPNEAIIEEGDRRVVYVEEKKGQFRPREIQAGVQGELYTEIQGGLTKGDEVVTFGSFFIDSEYKLKLSGQ